MFECFLSRKGALRAWVWKYRAHFSLIDPVCKPLCVSLCGLACQKTYHFANVSKENPGMHCRPRPVTAGFPIHDVS